MSDGLPGSVVVNRWKVKVIMQITGNTIRPSFTPLNPFYSLPKGKSIFVSNYIDLLISSNPVVMSDCEDSVEVSCNGEYQAIDISPGWFNLS